MSTFLYVTSKDAARLERDRLLTMFLSMMVGGCEDDEGDELPASPSSARLDSAHLIAIAILFLLRGLAKKCLFFPAISRLALMRLLYCHDEKATRKKEGKRTSERKKETRKGLAKWKGRG